MTTCERSSLLKDVIAYVDVWSSDKRANYSKPFVEQLHEMGAQVSKTFSKKVTHVIFNNGHPATWRNAKKSHVKLVSVLWVGKCYDEGVHVDEDSYPALNDDSNPVLKNKKHRCMLPKDFPERTPENDRRMKKKLDKMMKDLAPKEPLVTDVSPVIIDEKNGIVYSPALKRSDYMARRLKDMKEKHENLSPTASQMFESSSPTGPKPFLGSSPSVPKFLYEQSDDDSSASVAELGYSPDKEEGRTQLCKGDCPEKTMRKDFENPWLSPCQEVPGKTSISPLKCPDFEDKEEEGRRQQKSRRTSVRKRLSEKEEHVSESPRQETTSALSKNVSKERRQSRMKLASPVDKKHEQSPKKSRKGKQNIKVAKTLSDRTPPVCPDAEDSSARISSLAFCGEASPPQKLKNKTPKRGRLSLPAHMAPLVLPGQSQSAASTPADKDGNDDDVFEDFFSPAHHHKRPQWPLLQSLPKGKDIQVPFELDFAPKKRKGRRSESTSSGTSSGKKRKLEEDESTKSSHCSNTEPKSNPQLLMKESLPALDSPRTDFTLVAKRRRQSTLSFISAGAASETQRRASTSARLVRITETDSAVELQETSNTDERPHTLESRGNECTVAAGTAECLSEGGENENTNLQKMVKTKAVRTLVMTSMPTEKQHTVVQVVKALGGFVIADQVCDSTTHVVSGEHRRTLNILLGIARGCWILSFEWILWCLEQRQWIPEEPYELSEQFPAAQICRLQRHLSAGEHQQDLFQDQPAMFVSQHSQPPTRSLVELIVLCGGTVCKSVRQAGICIGKYRGRRPEGSRILSEQWVLDSITHLKQLPYDKYNLE